METAIKTKKEIFQDVVNLVQSQGGRAIEDKYCTYKTKDGKICGHSMALTDEARDTIVEKGQRYDGAEDTIELLGGDTCHKLEYRGYTPYFWAQLQEFHDSERYWNGSELSKEGKELIEEY
jgi:hypothetical protein